MVDNCDFPRCKQCAIIGYIGKNICFDHWDQLCEASAKDEKKLLKKIKLKRNKCGEVEQITD